MTKPTYLTFLSGIALLVSAANACSDGSNDKSTINCPSFEKSEACEDDPLVCDLDTLPDSPTAKRELAFERSECFRDAGGCANFTLEDFTCECKDFVRVHFGDEFSGHIYYYAKKDGELVSALHYSDSCDECGCGRWEGPAVSCKCDAK